jgi:hypothetical protein
MACCTQESQANRFNGRLSRFPAPVDTHPFPSHAHARHEQYQQTLLVLPDLIIRGQRQDNESYSSTSTAKENDRQNY